MTTKSEAIDADKMTYAVWKKTIEGLEEFEASFPALLRSMRIASHFSPVPRALLTAMSEEFMAVKPKAEELARALAKAENKKDREAVDGAILGFATQWNRVLLLKAAYDRECEVLAAASPVMRGQAPK